MSRKGPEHPCWACGAPTRNEVACSLSCASRARMRHNLPLEPLLDIVRPRLHAADVPLPYIESVTARAAVVLGITQRRVLRFRKAGMEPNVADAICTRLGYNPIEVWGGDWTGQPDHSCHTRAV